MFTVLANRTYRHLFLAQVIALLGTGLATVALGLLSYELAGANAPDGEVVKATTCAPSACASLMPMWPRPPSPTIATFSPQPIVKLTFSTEGSFWVR